MYAIVDIAGQQFKVEKDQKLFVHRLEGKEGSKVAFDKVYLIDTGSKTTVGDPVVSGAAVSAKILEHVKGDKVLVFKKKRRKGYKKLTGHRQYLTRIQIESIAEKGAKPAAEKKEAAPAKAAPVKEAKPAAASVKKAPDKKPAAANEKKAAPAKKPAAVKKPAAAKSTAASKTAAKKSEPKKEKPAATEKKDEGKEKASES